MPEKGEKTMQQVINFGLCDPPEPIYLYVRAGEDGDDSPWYRFNVDTQQKIPVVQRGLCGRIQELRLTNKEYKGKTNFKLDIVIQADEQYIVRTGVETYFAKTFLLAIAQFDVSKPLILAVVPGEENTVFARIYDANTKQRIKADWNKDADWAGIIASIQARLNQNQSTSGDQVMPSAKPAGIAPSECDRDLLMQEISSIMKRKDINVEQGKEMLNKWYRKASRQTLTDKELIDFRNQLALV
jgi:hypothetical protein